MKTTIFSSLMIIVLFNLANAQTTLFSENFESGNQGFTLNTADLSSNTGNGGSNYWVVNNAYSGGSGSLICLGFPFSFTVNNTASQPAGVTNNPNSSYMHISSAAAVSSGINCASFTAADGLCNFDENNFTKMSTDISTVGYDSIELSFYWLCAGGPQSYGELYYSTNSGSSWLQVNTPTTTLNNQSSWIQRKLSLADFEQKPAIRFGFRFVNLTATSASDPSLGIDEFIVRGFVNAPAATITAPSFNAVAFCPGDVFNLNFNTTGAFNAGNVFTAQLSNSSGSFISPLTIGQLTAQSASAINVTIPPGTAAGNGYRIRVVSSSPNIIGADNGINISIGAGPNSGIAISAQDTLCSGISTTVTLNGVSDSAIWQQSSNGSSFIPSNFVGNSFNTGPLTQSVYLRAIVSNSCGSDTSNTIYIHINPSPTAAFSFVQGNGLAINFTNNSSGTFNSSSWDFGNGNQSSLTDPVHVYTASGLYLVSLTVSNSFGCSSTFVDSVEIFPVAVNYSDYIILNTKVYPNPTHGNFTIDFSMEESTGTDINLLDILGRNLLNIFSGFCFEGNHKLQSELNLNPGIYYIEIKTEKVRQLHRLFIK